jgi:asparagine synthase (glutamine-hydrolysing)
MRALIAVVSKKGENSAETAVAMLATLKHKGADSFGVASPTHVIIEESAEQLQTQDLKSPIAIGHVFSKILTPDKPQPIKLDDATLVFEGRIYHPKTQPSSIEFAAEKLKEKRDKNATALLKGFEGNFAFAVAEFERLIVGRDSLGLYPLYYGENTSLAALASECMAVWKIGIKEAKSFPPGYLAIVDKNGFKFKHVRTLSYPMVKPITMQTAVKKLQRLLKQSVKERVSGLKEVAVAFSGGLDSSLIAFLAKNLGVNVHLIFVSLKNQLEMEQVKEAAEALKLQSHVYLYSEKDVEEVLPKVLWIIEKPDPIKTSIGIPIFWTAEKTAEIELKILLTGQGADELLGGYRRYLNDYSRYGEEFVQKTIFNDIVKMHEVNFERDSKICGFHNIELRLPLVTYQLAKFALSLPLKLKIESPNDQLRKIVLRKVAENIGLPPQIVNKRKRAIQYTTGVNKSLKKLAKRKGLSLREYLHKMFQKALKGIT